MPKCDHCGKIRYELEDWGIVKLCSDCVKYYQIVIPEKPPREPDLEIDFPKSAGGATYNPICSTIQFHQKNNPVRLSWEEMINHEFIHFLLHRLISVQCCYQFDNIAKKIDPFYA